MVYVIILTITILLVLFPILLDSSIEDIIQGILALIIAIIVVFLIYKIIESVIPSYNMHHIKAYHKYKQLLDNSTNIPICIEKIDKGIFRRRYTSIRRNKKNSCR